ncbi:unnamed protein product [Phytophthora fragariaefolia]|uniref:RNA-directed DNA polymerase n=1 Tax=Phytophthora fragariaefolia TaxID=1490495 RepID=A0A9W7CNF1_9STRA|nr:unnamed protein product [Phytophthora fragariaefolia]
MTVLIDSGASFNFATKASVARNNALYASALEASKSNTNVFVCLPTGPIVSTRKVTIPLSVKFDDFNSFEPFIVLDMDDRYDLILGMPWLAKHEPWIDWRSRTIGASHNPLADRALAGHVPSSSRDGFVHEHCVRRADRQFAGSSEFLQLPSASPPRAREFEVGNDEDPQDPRTPPFGREDSAVCNRVAYVQETVTPQGADAVTARAGKGGGVRAPPTHSVAAGSAHVEEGAGVVTRTDKSGRAGTPTTQGVVAGSARATEGAGACARATTGGQAGAPTSKVIRGDKVTGTPKAEASDRDADSAAEDRAPQVLNVFTGEPKVGKVLTPLSTVAELLELEELSYVEFLDSLKAGELAEVVLLRSEDDSLELNSSSVMDSEVLEDRTSRREISHLYPHQPPAGWIDVSTSDLVVNPILAILPLLFQGFLSEPKISLGQGIAPSPLQKEQVDVIDAFFAAKHAAGMVRESKSPYSSLTFCVRKPNGKWRKVHAFNKLNAATIPASTPIPRTDVLQNNMAGCTVFSALDMVDGYYQLLMRESDIPLTAVSTSSGMLWEWLVMPQGLSNAPATFNRLVTQLFRPMRHFVQTYFDDIFVHSRASEGKTAVEATSVSVVCDASDFAIGCALLQADAEGRERVVSFQSRQLKAAEKNYPVHDKELLAMKYALVKFRVHLLGQKPFVIYTDHASLRAATSSPHVAQRMTRWLSFFAEYNFTVEYKPGKHNVLADALSRRPDYELAHLAYLESPRYELICEAYAGDGDLAGLVEALSVSNKTVGLTARQP